MRQEDGPLVSCCKIMKNKFILELTIIVELKS